MYSQPKLDELLESRRDKVEAALARLHRIIDENDGDTAWMVIGNRGEPWKWRGLAPWIDQLAQLP